MLRPSRKKDPRRDSTGSNFQVGIRAASARLRKAASLHSTVSPKKSKSQHDQDLPPSQSVDMERLRNQLAGNKHDDRSRSMDRDLGVREKSGFGFFKGSRPDGSYARLSTNKEQSFPKLKRDGSFGRLSLRRGRSRSRDRTSEKPSKASSARDIREFGRGAFTPHKMKTTPISDTRLDDSSSDDNTSSLGPSSFGVRSDSAPRSFETRSDGPRSLQPVKASKFRKQANRSPITLTQELSGGEPEPMVSPRVRGLAPHSELCEHCNCMWPSNRRAWMSLSGDFHISDGDDEESRTRVLRYEKFRAELGFCVAFWVIARPERALDASAARRWGLVGNTTEPLGGFVIRLFLADRNEHGFVAGTYYASADVSRGGYKAVALHTLSLESLRVVLTWARHVKDLTRAPRFPDAPQLTAPIALDIIDEFCTENRGTVLGPPPRNAL